MPRKEPICKNSYCRRSKLDDREYFSLLDVYFGEVLYGLTRKESYNDFNLEFSRHKTSNQKTFSEQALGSNFQKIGQYIWDNFVVEEAPLLKDKKVLDELFDLLYGKIDKISIYKDVYDTLDKFPLFINASNIAGSLFFYLLSHRSRAARGFKNDTFYLEVSRVYFICLSAEKFRDKITSIYISTAYPIRAGLVIESKWRLSKILEKKPIGSQ